MPLPVLLGVMLLAGLCALLALNTASAAQELKQSSLTDANANASDQEQQLIRDLASKQAPSALAAAAAAQGLVPNPNPAFLRINANGSVTVLGSAVPASSPVVPPPASATPSKTATASKTPAKPTPKTSKTPARSSGAKSSTAPRPGTTTAASKAKPSTNPTTSSPGGR